MINFTNETKVGTTKNGRKKELLKGFCECGKEVRINKYQRNYVQSCGCAKNKKLYPECYHRAGFGYKTRSNIGAKRHLMMNRCYNQSNDSYAKYGAKGIGVCDRWHDFYNFFDDMYESYQQHLSIHGSKNTTLDRIDSTLGYSFENCRWATLEEQNNNLLLNRFFTIDGVTKSASQRAKCKGMNVATLFSRLNIGKLDIETALNKPINKSNKKKVYQYSLDNEFIRERPSAGEASKATGISINSIYKYVSGARAQNALYIRKHEK